MTCRLVSFRSFLAGAVAIVGAADLLGLNSTSAQGVSRSWVGGGATDDWYDAANWSPNGSPDQADFLSFSSGDVAGLNTNLVQINDGGRIEINSLSAAVTLDFLLIGWDGQGTLDMNGGTLTTNSATIGSDGNSFGTANITDSDSSWNITDETSSDLIVGDEGEGRLNITDFADVTVSDDGFIGFDDGGTGVVDISGSGSTLSFNGSNSMLSIGRGGNGTLNIVNSAAVSNDDSSIGIASGSLGKVTIDSAGAWTNTGSMTVGDAGTGTLEIRGGGTATSTSTGTIGDDSTSFGRVLVDGAGSLWDLASGLTVGFDGNAEIDILDGGRVENSSASVGESIGGTGQVTVRGIGSIWDSSSSLTIGNFGTATLTIAEDGAVENTNATIAANVGSDGTVNVDGFGSQWSNNGALVVGGAGTGRLNVTANATITSQSGAIGDAIGGDGTVNVAGTGSSWTDSDAVRVGNAGTGTLNVTSGASVSAASNAFIGDAATGNGTVTVSDSGSTLTVAGNLDVTDADGGTGSLSINDGGHVDIDSLTSIGAGGTLTLAEGTLTTGALTSTTGATLDIQGGTLTVNGGPFAPPLEFGVDFTVDSTTLATVNLTNGAVDSTVRWIIGDNGNGVVNFRSGATHLFGGAAIVGFFPGSNGTFNISGAGTHFDGGPSMLVGGIGSGALNVTDGATVDGINNFTIADDGASTGVVNVSGGSSISAVNFTIGDNDGGDATVTIGNGGQMTGLAGGLIQSGPNGKLILDGGTFTASGTDILLGGGTIDFRSGTLNLEVTNLVDFFTGLNVPTGGVMNVNSLVFGPLTSQPGSTINVTGPNATLGHTSPVLGVGVDLHGELNVDVHDVTLDSLFFAQLGALTTINGGSITAANGVALGVGDNLSGTGTVSARVAAGLGSTISASGGNLTLGDSTSPIGFASDGMLNTGPNTVTLEDSNLVALGALTTLGEPGTGGVLDVANGAVIDFADNLTGFGMVQSPDDSAKPIINNGSVAGLSGGEPITFAGYVKGIGTFSDMVFGGTFAPGLSTAVISAGALTFSSTSELEIELGGLAPGSGYDQINSSSVVTLGGNLDVALINSFFPTPSETFEIMTFASRSGEFATVSGDVGLLDPVTFLLPLYSGTNLLLFTAIPGDGNLSGAVEAGDYTIWANEFGIGDEFTEGDYNGDGTVGPADYTLWANNFGLMSSAPESSPAAVPEPSALLLALIGITGTGLTMRRRGRRGC